MKHKWHKEIKAWANGAEIEVKKPDGWEIRFSPKWHPDNEYRIKPEPKPDLVRYIKLNPEELDYISGDLRWRVQQGVFCYSSKQNKDDNLRLIIDGETGKLKSAEVLK